MNDNKNDNNTYSSSSSSGNDNCNAHGWDKENQSLQTPHQYLRSTNVKIRNSSYGQDDESESSVVASSSPLNDDAHQYLKSNDFKIRSRKGRSVRFDAVLDLYRVSSISNIPPVLVTDDSAPTTETQIKKISSLGTFYTTRTENDGKYYTRQERHTQDNDNDIDNAKDILGIDPSIEAALSESNPVIDHNDGQELMVRNQDRKVEFSSCGYGGQLDTGAFCGSSRPMSFVYSRRSRSVQGVSSRFRRGLSLNSSSDTYSVDSDQASNINDPNTTTRTDNNNSTNQRPDAQHSVPSGGIQKSILRSKSLPREHQFHRNRPIAIEIPYEFRFPEDHSRLPPHLRPRTRSPLIRQTSEGLSPMSGPNSSRQKKNVFTNSVYNRLIIHSGASSRGESTLGDAIVRERTPNDPDLEFFLTPKGSRIIQNNISPRPTSDLKYGAEVDFDDRELAPGVSYRSVSNNRYVRELNAIIEEENEEEIDNDNEGQALQQQ